mmetsp:Transcript_28164/g.79542  ORF Transcript_28164/g.79542 Transcript_28164/m.79542 type:complete len:214 (-) Transcript_28164:1271-1912(-)
MLKRLELGDLAQEQGVLLCQLLIHLLEDHHGGRLAGGWFPLHWPPLGALRPGLSASQHSRGPLREQLQAGRQTGDSVPVAPFELRQLFLELCQRLGMPLAGLCQEPVGLPETVGKVGGANALLGKQSLLLLNMGARGELHCQRRLHVLIVALLMMLLLISPSSNARLWGLSACLPLPELHELHLQSPPGLRGSSDCAVLVGEVLPKPLNVRVP